MLKQLISKLFPYRISCEEKSFIDENKKNWNSPSLDAPVGLIVEGINDSPASILDKVRLSKIVEETYDVKTLVVCSGFYKISCNVAKIIESFHINKFMYIWRKYLNFRILLLSLLSTVKFYRVIDKPGDMTKYESSGILIGDLIYDTIIRYNPGTYTITKLKLKGHLRHIFRAFANALYYEKIFSCNNIVAVVTSHTVYVEYGILSRLGYKYGAKVLLKDHNIFKVYDHSVPILESCLRIRNSELETNISTELLHKADLYIKERFDGSITNSTCGGSVDTRPAFCNKKLYTKENLFELFEIAPNRENYHNVFVMAHAFSDAPHFGESLLFDDYYCWLTDTLECLSTISNINIFLKAHPSAYMWNEEDAIDGVLSKWDEKTINLLPSDFNTASVKDIADCVITAQGTAGLEFSCFGVPALTAAKGWYDRFGFTLDSETKSEYFNKLLSITKIKKLSTEEINTAKSVFYLSMMKLRRSKILPEEDICPHDVYKNIYKSHYHEIFTKLKSGVKMKDDVYEYYRSEIIKYDKI